jgi:hypothetical protein
LLVAVFAYEQCSEVVRHVAELGSSAASIKAQKSHPHLSMSHSNHVHALRQPLKQSCNGIAHLLPPLQVPNAAEPQRHTTRYCV